MRPACVALWRWDGARQPSLAPAPLLGDERRSRLGYQSAGGWTAFVVDDGAGSPEVRLASPDGVIETVSAGVQPGADTRVVVMGR